MAAGARRRIAEASVTPLSSIFGSGFLIIVPVLERTVGDLAVPAIAAVCALAWVLGTAVRHNVAAAEGTVSATTRRLDRLDDVVIVVAYIISVALYLRILGQYVVDAVGGDSAVAEQALASAALAVILVVGVTRGFGGLDVMQRLALGAVLIVVFVLGGALLVHDASHGVGLPPGTDRSTADVLRVLAGTVITVQGFETVRFLADEYDADLRVKASRLAQVVATLVYIGFVAVATPVMGLGTDAGPDGTLLDITDRVVPLLTVPLVVCAVLSQFSAATADTVAADGNLRGLLPRLLRDPRAYVASGLAAAVLIWIVPLYPLIALASRAFAAYYALECVMAAVTSPRIVARIGFGALAVVMVAVTVLAIPAG